VTQFAQHPYGLQNAVHSTAQHSPAKHITTGDTSGTTSKPTLASRTVPVVACTRWLDLARGGHEAAKHNNGTRTSHREQGWGRLRPPWPQPRPQSSPPGTTGPAAPPSREGAPAVYPRLLPLRTPALRLVPSSLCEAPVSPAPHPCRLPGVRTEARSTESGSIGGCSAVGISKSGTPHAHKGATKSVSPGQGGGIHSLLT